MREFITFVRGCMSDGPRRLRDWRNACARQLKFSEDPNESGAALVEFTIIVPVFFLLMFGMIEFGLIFFFQNTMVSAAEEAARDVAVLGNTTPKSLVCPWLVANSMSGSLQFTINITQCPVVSGVMQQSVQATITTSASSASVINYLNMIGGTLTTTVQMYNELGVCTATTNLPQFTCP